MKFRPQVWFGSLSAETPSTAKRKRPRWALFLYYRNKQGQDLEIMLLHTSNSKFPESIA